MFSNTLAVVFAAFFAQSAFAADCARKYTVKEGDICDSISAANQVSTYQLAVVNQGHIDSTCSNLTPGDEICLGNAGEDCTTTYTVKDNDTCDGINSATGLNSTILYLNNPQINEACDNIYIGEVLCVAKTVQVPVAPSGGIPATTIPATATPAVPSAVKTPAAAVSSTAVPPSPEAPTPAASSSPVPEATEAPAVAPPSPAPVTTKAAPAPHNLAPAPTSSPSTPAPEPAKNSNVNAGDDDGEDDDENCDDDGEDGDDSADNAGDNAHDDNDGADDDDDADDADLPFCDEMEDN